MAFVDYDALSAFWNDVKTFVESRALTTTKASCTLASGYTSSGFNARKFGNVREVTGLSVKPGTDTTFGTSSVTIGTVPEAYRPTHTIYGTVKTTDHYVGRLSITTSGNVNVSYLTNGTEYLTGQPSMGFTITWLE